ncbi:MAG: alpha/beta hydrolase [Acidimicrobiia bacterium]|nr:alpha/beta hydrolase [Acidimicrobiia bacterium]
MSQIIFVHGAGLDAASWRYQTRFFAESIAVDLPGHGNSSEEALSRVTAYAEWLGAEMRRLDSGPVALAGHSMGSLIVLETAARNPDFVSHLVLMATAATMPVHRDLLAAANANDPEAAALVMKWSIAERPGFGRPKEWVDDIAKTFSIAAEQGVLARDFAACNSYSGAAEVATAVQCPTLLLLGERDVMTKPSAAQPLAAALGDARIVIIEGAGHMMPFENTAAVNDAITLFLAPN